MKKILILTIILSNMGFSQDCENSILDEAVQNENVNQYFQIALSLNVSELGFLNDCDSDETYTMFIPGISVPASSAATLLSLDGELIEYIYHFIHAGEITLGSVYNNLPMMDNNNTTLNVSGGPNGLNYGVDIMATEASVDAGWATYVAVSYTHLTLPTKRIV